MKEIWLYIKAHLFNARCWRVEYKDGQRTSLLTKRHAMGLYKMWGQRMYIDYYHYFKREIQ